MLLDLIAKFGLLLGFPGTYALVIIIGFTCFNKRIFGTTLFLLFFTMIYNYYLKSIWQMPFPPPLEGWAFPSGHTHSAVVFWGWLAYQYRSRLGWGIAFLFICLVGFGLVHDGYHYTKDVLAAMGFGAVSLIVYYFINQLIIINQKPQLLGILFIILSSILMLILPPGSLKPHLWQAMGGLIGFTLGWWLLQSKEELKLSTFEQRAKLSVVALAGVGCIAMVFYFLPLMQDVILFMRMFCISVWVNAVCVLRRGGLYVRPFCP